MECPTIVKSSSALAGAIPQLCRGGLSLSVAATAACGALLCGTPRDAGVAFSAVLLLAAGASALNQVQEGDADKDLARTRGRPIPFGTVSPQQASLLAGVLLLAGVAILALGSGSGAPLLPAVAALLLYNGAYTPLKRITAAALLPGAVAGALPPIIGAAVTGRIPPSTVVLAGAILVWQVPHTWLIELQHRADYIALPRPSFCRLFSQSQLERLVFTWNIAFAALPPLLVLAAGGIAHPQALGAAFGLSLVLTLASAPLLSENLPKLSYGRLGLLLRVCLLLTAGLAAAAAR